jgi:hypothetical protein
MLILALGLSALAALAPRTSGDPERLEAALATISADEIAADLRFFASQEMRGRDTPSTELRVAARFVRARLQRLGFRPGAGESYFHEYTLARRAIDPLRSRLHVEGPGGAADLAFGTDYFLASTSDLATLSCEGPVVVAGGGDRKEFDGLAVQGAWALCRSSDMPARRRARYAESAGAVGVIVLPGADEDPARDHARTTEVALHGMASPMMGNEAERARDTFPQIFLSPAAGRRVLALLGAQDLPALGTRLDGKVLEERAGSGPYPVENVCAFWPGSDPVLSKEVILVSAHYDHVGVTNGVVYPGADDNGSGSMGLLALAEALAEYGPMRRSVMLLWVSGEEKGLWGSAAWTRSPTLPAGHRAVCDLNIDMIGRNAPDYLLITPTSRMREYNGLTRLAEGFAPQEGFAPLGSADEYWRRSDHMNFADNLRIPVAFLFSDVHEDYHKPGDTPDKIDHDKIRRVVRLVLRMIDALQSDKLEL